MKFLPFLVFFAPAVLGEECPQISPGGCPVCGPGRCVSAPHNIFSFPGQPAMRCEDIENAGLQGLISANMCPVFATLLSSDCECEEDSTTPPGPSVSMIPSTSPSMSLNPSSAPSAAPSTAPSMSSMPSLRPSTTPSTSPSMSLMPTSSLAPSTSPTNDLCEDLESGQCIDTGCQASGIGSLNSFFGPHCNLITCKCESCFSGSTLVELENGELKQMEDLRLGDRVLVAKRKYEPVYSFGHRSTSGVMTKYLQIRTKSSTGNGLEVTPKHLVFAENNRLVTASEINVGDKIQIPFSSKVERVLAIKMITRTGIYAPFTPSGVIVVNGIQASCFATIQDGVTVSLGGYELPLTYHQLALVFESPHRLLCYFFMGTCMKYESYDVESGLSNWVALPMKGFTWLVKQNIMFSGVLFMLLFLFFCMINLLEMVVTLPLFSGIAACLIAVVVVSARFHQKKNSS